MTKFWPCDEIRRFDGISEGGGGGEVRYAFKTDLLGQEQVRYEFITHLFPFPPPLILPLQLPTLPHLDFFGPKWHSLLLFPFQGPPLKTPLVMVLISPLFNGLNEQVLSHLLAT